MNARYAISVEAAAAGVATEPTTAAATESERLNGDTRTEARDKTASGELGIVSVAIDRSRLASDDLPTATPHQLVNLGTANPMDA